MRIKLLQWLHKRFAKDSGYMGPKWLTNLYRILFPIRSVAEKMSGISFRIETLTYIIEGQEISVSFFKTLRQAAEDGELIQLSVNELGHIQFIKLRRCELDFNNQGGLIGASIVNEITKGHYHDKED